MKIGVTRTPDRTDTPKGVCPCLSGSVPGMTGQTNPDLSVFVRFVRGVAPQTRHPSLRRISAISQRWINSLELTG